jgi:hypothetical protein
MTSAMASVPHLTLLAGALCSVAPLRHAQVALHPHSQPKQHSITLHMALAAKAPRLSHSAADIAQGANKVRAEHGQPWTALLGQRTSSQCVLPACHILPPVVGMFLRRVRAKTAEHAAGAAKLQQPARLIHTKSVRTSPRALFQRGLRQQGMQQVQRQRYNAVVSRHIPMPRPPIVRVQVARKVSAASLAGRQCLSDGWCETWPWGGVGEHVGWRPHRVFA